MSKTITSLLFCLICLVAAEEEGFEISQNNIIGEIPKVGMKWKLSFDLKPTGAPTNPGILANILALKSGSRHGLQILKMGFSTTTTRLSVCTYDNIACVHETKDLDIGQFHTISLEQFKDSDGKLKLKLKVESNGNSREKILDEVQQNAAAYRDVKVFAALNEKSFASARIKNLKIDDYEFLDGKLEQGFKISQNNMVGEIPKVGMEWKMSFDLKPTAAPTKPGILANILALKSGSRHGLQILKMGFSTTTTRLSVCTYDNIACVHEIKDLDIGQFHTISLEQFKDSDGKLKLKLKVESNGKSREKILDDVQQNPAAYTDVKIFAALNEKSFASARIRNLKIDDYVYTDGKLRENFSNKNEQNSARF